MSNHHEFNLTLYTVLAVLFHRLLEYHFSSVAARLYFIHILAEFENKLALINSFSFLTNLAC